ncbi:MAG: PASTA domain-containing protein, partial [Enterococcus devriesei]
YVSSGTQKVAIKDYKGEKIRDAQDDLQDIGFLSKNIRIELVNSDTIPEDQIISQEPKAGTKVDPKNDEVVFQVSDGPKTIKIGNYTGWEYQNAREELLELGITDSQINQTPASDDVVPAGEVISQNPVGGTELTAKDTITLKVSTGSDNVQLDDQTGKDKADAEATITNLGLKYLETQEFSSEVAAGKVISTNPSAGSVKKGSTVTIIVSKGPEETQESEEPTTKTFDVTIAASFTGSGDQKDTMTVLVTDAKNKTATQKLDFTVDKNTQSAERTVSVTTEGDQPATIEVQRNGNSVITKSDVSGAETITVP